MNNVVRGNAMVAGKTFADRRTRSPMRRSTSASQAANPVSRPAPTEIEIYDNAFDNNWSGITAWENADRFCNSPANTSTGVCTPLVPNIDECSQPYRACASSQL